GVGEATRGERADDEELVTPEPGDHVAVPGRCPEAVGRGADGGVTGVVTMGVVELLEAVEIEEESEQRRSVPLGPSEVPRQGLHRRTPVQQAGEAVVRRQLDELGPAGLR